MGTQLTRWDGLVVGLTGALLLIWWLPVSTLVPDLNARGDLTVMVDNSTWALYNAPGAVAAVLLPGVIVGLYVCQKPVMTKVGQVGFYLALVGAVIFAWVQLEQTLVWPTLLAESPGLLELSGAMFASPPFAAVYWVGHGMMGVGFALFGRTTSRLRVFPRWAGLLMAFGGLGLCIPIVIPWIRILGVLMLGPALMWMGYILWRDRLTAY